MRTTNTEFEKYMREAAAMDTEPQLPDAWHNPDGDYIEFVFEPEEYFAHCVDDLVTVYVGRKSGNIVGSKLKGIVQRLRESSFLVPYDPKSGESTKRRIRSKAVIDHEVIVTDSKVRITHILLRESDSKAWAEVTRDLNFQSADKEPAAYKAFVYKTLFVKANSSSADLVAVKESINSVA